MRQRIEASLVHIMACGLVGTKLPLHEPMLNYFQLNHKYQTPGRFESKSKFVFHGNAFEKIVCKMFAVYLWTRVVYKCGHTETNILLSGYDLWAGVDWRNCTCGNQYGRIYKNLTWVVFCAFASAYCADKFTQCPLLTTECISDLRL